MAFIVIHYRLNALYFAVNSIFVVLSTHIWINFKLLQLYKKMFVVLRLLIAFTDGKTVKSYYLHIY